MLEYQNIKMFLQKAMFQICLKKFLWFKKLERFTKKNCKNPIKKSLEVGKLIKRKGNKLYVRC